MDASDKIGLVFYWAWLPGLSVVWMVVICLAITPGAMMIIARLFESRKLPLHPNKQFLSFFPGDIFLGIMTSGLLALAHRVPAEHRWYNSPQWHVTIQIVSVLAALVLTWGEYRQGIYPRRALFSPTKLYHNFLLYAGYGYLIVVTLTAVAVGAGWSLGLLISLSFGIAWLAMLMLDNTITSANTSKAATAHVEDWRPIWRK